MNNIEEIQGFTELQEKTNASNRIRQAMVDKLKPVVDNMEIAPGNEKPTMTEAKLNVIKTMDDLLKSGEEALSSNIKILLQNKKTDNEDKHSEIVATMLKQISTKFTPVSVQNNKQENLDQKLEDSFRNSNEHISDNELSENEDLPQSEMLEEPEMDDEEPVV